MDEMDKQNLKLSNNKVIRSYNDPMCFQCTEKKQFSLEKLKHIEFWSKILSVVQMFISQNKEHEN